MKSVEKVVFTMDSEWELSVSSTFIRSMKVVGLNKENIIQTGLYFVKINTADEICITIKKEHNHEERFENGYVNIFDRLKERDVKSVTVYYDDETSDAFELALSKIEVFEYTETKDLRFYAYIPKHCVEELIEGQHPKESEERKMDMDIDVTMERVECKSSTYTRNIINFAYLYNLYKEHLRQYDSKFVDDMGSTDGVLREDNTEVLLFRVSGGEAIGFAILETPSGKIGDAEIQIRDFYVKKEGRRHGIGTKMLLMISNLYVAMNYSVFILAKNTDAVEFFETAFDFLGYVDNTAIGNIKTNNDLILKFWCVNYPF